MPAIRVRHYSFAISEPYAAGHPLSEAEAQALNTTRTQNIRDWLRARMSALPDVLSESQLDTLTEELAQYDASYAFGRHASRPRDSAFATAVQTVAMEFAEAELKASGVEVTPETVAGEALRIASSARVQTEARKRIQISSEAARRALEELFS